MAIPILYDRVAAGYAEMVQRQPRAAFGDLFFLMVTAFATAVLACTMLNSSMRRESLSGVVVVLTFEMALLSLLAVCTIAIKIFIAAKI